MLKIDMRSRTPIYEQIIESIKEQVIKGVLSPGEKLTSVRELAKDMTLNPNTVQKAYQELERQGIICTLRGKGTFICEDIIATDKSGKKEELYQNLKKLMIEAAYLEIPKDDLLKKISDLYDENVSRGDKND